MSAKKFKSLSLSECKKHRGPISLKELRVLAKKEGIKGYSTLNKSKLCNVLKKHYTTEKKKVTFAKYPSVHFFSLLNPG